MPENYHLPPGLERRKEDYGLITGRSHYVDDLRPPAGRPPALVMAVVRSPYAHARITAITCDPALALPGVVGAFPAADLVSAMPSLMAVAPPDSKKPARRPLALDKVRYVGDPVAVVLAEDSYTAADARDLVEVEYEPLPAVVNPERAAQPDAPLLYEEFGTNIAYSHKSEGGDVQAVFAHAEHHVHIRMVNQRLAPSSIEPRVCMFDFDPASGQLTAWVSSQSIYRVRDTLAGLLQIPRERVHVYNAEVGGAFGAKNALLGEEIVAAILAVRYGRPVKWLEDRSENLQAQIHGRGQINDVEAAFQSDGRLLALKVHTLGDLGAFLAGITALIPTVTPLLLSGPYQLQAIESTVTGVFTNKVPTSAYRGAGRPEAAYILERVMDRIAHDLNLDPAEVRRRNFIPPTAFPYKTVTGLTYDSGNYLPALERSLELLDYPAWRQRQREARASNSMPFSCVSESAWEAEGKPNPAQPSKSSPAALSLAAGERRSQLHFNGTTLLGIGFSSFIENSGGAMAPNAPHEAATVRILPSGTVQVQCGVSHNGQGHYTAFAQIAAQVFDLPSFQVEVLMNDSALPGYSIGTFASRITQLSGPAILLAAEAVREKALSVAAHVLEASPNDLVVSQGHVSVRGVPARQVSLAELARLVEAQPDLIEHEPPNPVNNAPIEGLAAWRSFNPPDMTFGSGTHIAVVSVDRETGEVEVLRYVAVDDCGRVLNHYLAEAQIHGALAQGLGQALYEEVVYDQDGQPLTGTLMDYALPLAKQLPSFITDVVETPSPLNPLGVKGTGEGGTIGGPPAIVNAVLDALAPLGIQTIDMPVTPHKVWLLIQSAIATVTTGGRASACPP